MESLRAQIQVIFWRGIADLERYRQTPSPIDYNPPSERHDLDRIIGEIWTSRLDMDTAETERDSANDSELRLTRDPPSPTSRHTYNPAERSAFVMDYDSGSDGLSEDDLPSDLTPESTRSANGSASEAVPNLDEPASPSDSPLGTIGTMVFNMEFEGPATAVEAHEEVVPETNSDSASDVDMTMSRDRELGLYDTPPRPPIAIRTRNQSKREMAELDMEVFHDEVRGFSIGFHLNVFPWLVMRRIRRMRETALPGSFEHLLMHMFDDIRHVTVYQADVRRTGIQRCHEGASHDDALAGESSPDSSLEAGPCSQRPVVPGERILEGPLSANTLFVQELRVVRLMVAPIRDREIRFAWITSRTERPVELREQFQASKELIANFKRRLVRSLHQSETCKFLIRHHFPLLSFDTCPNLTFILQGQSAESPPRLSTRHRHDLSVSASTAWTHAVPLSVGQPTNRTTPSLKSSPANRETGSQRMVKSTRNRCTSHQTCVSPSPRETSSRTSPTFKATPRSSSRSLCRSPSGSPWPAGTRPFTYSATSVACFSCPAWMFRTLRRRTSAHTSLPRRCGRMSLPVRIHCWRGLQPSLRTQG